MKTNKSFCVKKKNQLQVKQNNENQYKMMNGNEDEETVNATRE